MFRNHGVTRDNLRNPSPGGWYYEMQELGLNYRLTDIQCALGIHQLQKLDGFIDARHERVARYEAAFKDISQLRLPVEREGVRSGWHIYPVRLQGELATRRADVFRMLREAGIGVQVHYIPVHWHPYYEDLGYKKGTCPKAEAYYEAEISLPLFPGLTEQDQETVIVQVKKIISSLL